MATRGIWIFESFRPPVGEGAKKVDQLVFVCDNQNAI